MTGQPRNAASGDFGNLEMTDTKARLAVVNATLRQLRAIVPAIETNAECSLIREGSEKKTPTSNACGRHVAKLWMHLPQGLGLALLLAVVLTPSVGWACACGCGVFDVGTGLMLPEGAGGMVYVNYDYQDQDHNWHGTSSAPDANNDDKEIRTHFVTVGLQYMFDRSWGLQVEVPYDDRYFKTTGGATGSDIVSLDWAALGDIRVQGIYTGFSEDLSSGVTFGFKLPTGDYTHNDAFGDVDRDSELGTGSTDILLGGFHRQNLQSIDGLSWFAQAELDLPVITRNEYRPGIELDTAAGIYYKGWVLRSVKITPVAQVIGSERTSDGGANAAHPVASGYQRIMLSPGVEFDLHPVSVYADVEVPVFQDFRGNQVVAPWLLKAVISYHF
jgi:hypothetical protein